MYLLCFFAHKKNQKSATQVKGKQNSSAIRTKEVCLHSQIISGDLVDTFDPYYRGYMKD